MRESRVGLARSRPGKNLDAALGSAYANPPAVGDQPSGVLDAHNSRQAVFACDHGTVGHEAADLGHQATDRDAFLAAG